MTSGSPAKRVTSKPGGTLAVRAAAEGANGVSDSSARDEAFKETKKNIQRATRLMRLLRCKKGFVGVLTGLQSLAAEVGRLVALGAPGDAKSVATTSHRLCGQRLGAHTSAALEKQRHVVSKLDTSEEILILSAATPVSADC
jgi:hypothetical protein